MEGLAVIPFSGIYRDRRVLVTGHTGFKGSWLCQWLDLMGVKVSGLALAPATDPAHWDLLSLTMPSYLQDVRDAAAVGQIVAKMQPEIVFHMAAQPLVRRSYRDPVETWSVNVMGTLNVLEACRKAGSVRAVVVVTTDKCYENFEIARGYREEDRLGGHDPYSASKAAAELLVASYRKSFLEGPDGGFLLASARAGNVIGGGDWSEDRLIPDLVRAVAAKSPLVIRSPRATRPWQHVLEPLSGYLTLGQRLLSGDRAAASAWNFGPGDEANQSVETVLKRLSADWPEVSWRVDAPPALHEAALLHLDSAKARDGLDWTPQWDLGAALQKTAEWYRAFLRDGQVLTRAQITDYVTRAKVQGTLWAA